VDQVGDRYYVSAAEVRTGSGRRIAAIHPPAVVRKGQAMPVSCQRPAARLFAGSSTPRFPLRGGHQEAGALLAGRYRLAEVIGRGATARVWRARDEVLDRDVAIKQFHQRRSEGPSEARTAARIRHPNVVTVNDVLPSGDLVMEYHDGPTLATLLRDGRSLPPPIVAALGQQLLAALQAVHAAGVVHCDVKPANLMVGDDGWLMLIDFGIAEIEGGAPAHPARRSGYVVGSPAYMAPELIRGKAPRPASDLWSLGATLYAAVEGRLPFPQDDTVANLAAVLHDPPAPARQAGRLQPLLARLLVKDPSKRPSYPAVHALLTEARSALDGAAPMRNGAAHRHPLQAAA
jgi:serine/threonine protein kinase